MLESGNAQELGVMLFVCFMCLSPRMSYMCIAQMMQVLLFGGHFSLAYIMLYVH